AWWDVRFVLLLAAATIINFAGSRAIVRSRARAAALALGATVAANLALLGWFKYYGFVSINANGAFASLGLASPLPLVQVTLPVGISFFTFMGISYVVDVPCHFDRRSGLRAARRTFRRGHASRGLRICGPDLGGLQRIHRHRDRHRAASGIPVSRQLRRPLCGHVASRLLAALAHDALA